MNRRVDRWRRRLVRNLQVYDLVLKPVARAVSWRQKKQKQQGHRYYHSRNLATHSFSSPLVSYFGYVSASTSILGRAWLTRATSCSGKFPKVSLPPCAEGHMASALALHVQPCGVYNNIRAGPTLNPCTNTRRSVFFILRAGCGSNASLSGKRQVGLEKADIGFGGFLEAEIIRGSNVGQSVVHARLSVDFASCRLLEATPHVPSGCARGVSIACRMS